MSANDEWKVRCKSCGDLIGYIRVSHGPFQMDCVACGEEDLEEEDLGDNEELDLEDDDVLPEDETDE